MTKPGQGANTRPLFTAEGAWGSGVYDLTFYFSLDSDLDAALASLWSFPSFSGPVGSREHEPWEQDVIAPSASEGGLYGVVTLPGGGQSVCQTHTFVFRESDFVPRVISEGEPRASGSQPDAESSLGISGDDAPSNADDEVVSVELSLSIPLGSLCEAWPEVGSFPFGVTAAEVEAWEPRLESFLFALAEHVHARTPFRRALVGFEGMFSEDLRVPGPIPQTRTMGIVDVRDDGLAWYPPTSRGGFVFAVPPHRPLWRRLLGI